MKDGLDTEIKPGSKVIWVSGKTNYAGVIVFEVERLTEKRVKLCEQKGALKASGKNTFVDPKDLVVVDPIFFWKHIFGKNYA